LFVFFFLELIVFHLQPYPFVNDDHANLGFFGHKIVVFMFLRLYLAFRVAHDFSPLFRQRTAILRRMKHGDHARAEVDFTTILKTYFNIYNLQFLSVAFGVLLLGGGYSVHIFERQYFVNASNIWDTTYAPKWSVTEPPLGYMRTPFVDYGACVWFTIVSACSVGYGCVLLSKQTQQ
jgi:hypothetical protein